MPPGKLILIPAPLGEGGEQVMPEYVLTEIHQLRYLIAERAKTARAYLKSVRYPIPFSELEIFELNKRTPPEELPQMLEPLRNGHNLGLLSEAGCPGVADPGAVIVEQAHQEGISVVPLVGPSSILLALMGSGMNGQRFCFHGYLSPKKPELSRQLKKLEQESSRLDQTQLFIETPYRNQAFMETALQSLQGKTRVGIAADLTLPTEYVRTQTVQQWKKRGWPNLHKRPAIFLIYAR